MHLAVECTQVIGECPRSVFENRDLSRDFFCRWAFGSGFFWWSVHFTLRDDSATLTDKA